MGNSENQYYRRRAGASYVTTVISITLVLFMLGWLGMVVLHAKKISNYVKENIGFSIMIKDGVKESRSFHSRKDWIRKICKIHRIYNPGKGCRGIFERTG